MEILANIQVVYITKSRTELGQCVTTTNECTLAIGPKGGGTALGEHHLKMAIVTKGNIVTISDMEKENTDGTTVGFILVALSLTEEKVMEGEGFCKFCCVKTSFSSVGLCFLVRQCRYTWPDGAVYSGYFYDGQHDGQGTYKVRDCLFCKKSFLVAS